MTLQKDTMNNSGEESNETMFPPINRIRSSKKTVLIDDKKSPGRMAEQARTFDLGSLSVRK